ncbi:hypothetical protein [Estrella lausannensis]|uniref:Uncharacterized protein n=1 Tax=Estrella lausannensis TaxID=483423 RepID=A0A0H5DPZ0_9BACT|nr:hypothetical protein [Estrella lausannensis]CRX38562.1 hypothetical protein ELAC_1221 [Estrella lausannensis]
MSISAVQGSIKVDLRPNNTMTAEKVVAEVAKISGPATIYCWYVGPEGLPKAGAAFMTDRIIRPLLEEKRDITLCLYSLEEWSFRRAVSEMTEETELTAEIARVSAASIKSLSSASFFQFCKEARKREELYREVSGCLASNTQLMRISERFAPLGITIDAFYGNGESLLDAIKSMDLKKAYSCMQYVEGYYLVRRLALKAIQEGCSLVNAAFVLPGGEGKYYRNFSEDLPKWLKKDLGEEVESLTIRVSFLFFKYQNGEDSRPYLTRSGDYVRPGEMSRYLRGEGKCSTENEEV